MRRTLLALAAVPAFVLAAGVTPATAAPVPTGMVRVAHLSPDAPAVDIYVDGAQRWHDVSFRAVSGYLRLPAGSHRVDMRAAGSATSAAPLLSATTGVPAGGARTVAALGLAAHLTPRVYTDDLSSPTAGNARLRVLHAAPGVGPADVAVAGGPILFRGAAYAAQTGYIAVPSGAYDVTMSKAGTSDVLLAAKGVAVRAGSVYSIWAVGGSGKPLSLVRALDASGAAVVPKGGAQTGGGGLAAGDLGLRLTGLGLLLLLGGAVTARRRRVGTSA